MHQHEDLTDAQIRTLLRQRQIWFAGNKPLKIMGRLDCKSGKKMKRQNRVFFRWAAEGRSEGYRPCGKCCPLAYQKWKRGKIWFGAFCTELAEDRC